MVPIHEGTFCGVRRRVNTLFAFWIPPLIFECMLCVLTICKGVTELKHTGTSLTRRKKGMSLIPLLVRDSAFYLVPYVSALSISSLLWNWPWNKHCPCLSYLVTFLDISKGTWNILFLDTIFDDSTNRFRSPKPLLVLLRQCRASCQVDSFWTSGMRIDEQIMDTSLMCNKNRRGWRSGCRWSTYPCMYCLKIHIKHWVRYLGWLS